MHLFRTIPALLACAAILFAGAAQAGVREDQFAQYASTAKAETPGFAGFSAERGKTLHTLKMSLVDGAREAMAASVTPARYTDPAKVEKWFKRNCTEVLGRVCTAQEKGDWLTFMLGQ